MLQRTLPRYPQMRVDAPALDAVRGRYATVLERARGARDRSEREAVISDWEAVRREFLTWSALARLRFQQDTRCADARRGRELADELAPQFADLESQLKSVLLADEAWRETVGDQAHSLWRADLATFDARIKDDLVREQKLTARYVELFGSARFDFEGEKGLTLTGLSRFGMDPSRERRQAAERARWAWFAERREELDRIFDELVTLRTKIARDLGHEDFVTLGYHRMRRVDYDRSDVENFRAQVRTELVPLCREIAAEQARELSLDRLCYWDEKVFGTGESPAPRGDHDWMIRNAADMFRSISPELAEFFDKMVEHELLDLEGREGKAVGGFCTYLHDYRMPFIFANFNGTRGDVRVFTHEMGHAFQRYKSSSFALTDYVGCTSESAEIHSMSLEFLTWPQMERFFGDAADEFRRVHLLEQLLFLPYGVAIDEFQHRVYENPAATPAERFAMWRDLEATYLPWRNWGDLEHPAEGGMWQLQRHVYLYPFYYIDYTLAATCALQLWSRSLTDHDGSMREYGELCARGGSMPFRELVRSAGLVPPFEDGCLRDVVASARAYLGL